MNRYFNDDRDWFVQNRLGLFVHWGVYAIHGWQEQEHYRAAVPRKKYVQLARLFNPIRFDPDAWLDLAREAGMSYLCFTAKHHDGFCLWDTAVSEFKVTRTPYARDVLAMLADACHRRNFPLCLYYSIADMNQANYPNAGRPYELPRPDPGDEPDLARYLEFLDAQVRELCTNYGKVHGFWWDGNVVGHRDPSINTAIRRLQPGIIINNRGPDEGDYGTPERDWDESVNTELSFSKPVEACQSVGYESWGYKKDENYYTDRYLLASIDKVMAKGGNFLLNAGPRADGTFPPQAVRILRTVGRWHAAVRESIEGVAAASHLTENRDVLLTRRGNTLYVHLVQPPAVCDVYLKPLATLPRKATLLNTGQAVEARVDLLPRFYRDGGRKYLRLCRLPANRLSGTVPVVKLEFDADPAG